MIHSDKFSSRIQPFLNTKGKEENFSLPDVTNKLNNTDLKFLGVRSLSMCSPSNSLYPNMASTS